MIEAYREATRLALEAAEKIIRTEETVISITFPYANMEQVMRRLKNSPARILSQDFGMDCRIEFAVRKDAVDEISSRLSDFVSIGGDVAD